MRSIMANPGRRQYDNYRSPSDRRGYRRHLANPLKRESLGIRKRKGVINVAKSRKRSLAAKKAWRKRKRNPAPAPARKNPRKRTTVKRKSSKRVAAGKKAWRTRKARGNTWPGHRTAHQKAAKLGHKRRKRKVARKRGRKVSITGRMRYRKNPQLQTMLEALPNQISSAVSKGVKNAWPGHRTAHRKAALKGIRRKKRKTYKKKGKRKKGRRVTLRGTMRYNPRFDMRKAWAIFDRGNITTAAQIGLGIIAVRIGQAALSYAPIPIVGTYTRVDNAGNEIPVPGNELAGTAAAGVIAGLVPMPFLRGKTAANFMMGVAIGVVLAGVKAIANFIPVGVMGGGRFTDVIRRGLSGTPSLFIAPVSSPIGDYYPSVGSPELGGVELGGVALGEYQELGGAQMGDYAEYPGVFLG